MANRVLFLKLTKNAVLLLAVISALIPLENVSAYSFYNQQYGFYQYSQPPLYLNALKPFKKEFDESLKPGITLNILALTLLKPNLIFDDLENLFKTTFSANPICFSQGGPKTYPPGRSFFASSCYDTPQQGCHSCACQSGYVGYIWDPTTGICGSAQ